MKNLKNPKNFICLNICQFSLTLQNGIKRKQLTHMLTLYVYTTLIYILDVFDKVPTIKNRLWRDMALSIDITQA